MKQLLGVLPMVSLLSGCAALQSNVRGNFACSAAEGTCAPTMTIDDEALAQLGAVGSTAQALSRAEGGPGRKARIVFPAYVDGLGRYHEARIVYATLDDGYASALGDVTGNDVVQPARPNLVTQASSGEQSGSGSTSYAPTDVPPHMAPNGSVTINSPAVFPGSPEGN